MGVVQREAGEPPVGENDRLVFIVRRLARGFFGAHSVIGRRVARLPFGIVLRLTPCRSARTMFVFSLVRIARRMLGCPVAIASFPVIDVIDPDDVILTEIAACLNLDQLQVDLARVCEPVG
jgi:hypothetical protein